ncbi:uncharacterized protein LOC143887548 isoform X1 [Tasmannia lanceolata]|uniref:uncharacterized protein LOC143887548 isoform X1 n=1 Tax=Tasmannia lanceolata TaxID=3420 RepID=UPI004062A027
MSRKRKSESSGLDELHRALDTTFCNAANSLSQLYAQSQNQQLLRSQIGERNALEKLHQWIMRRQEEGPRVNVADIVAYLQNELNYGGEDALMPPPPQNPNSNAQMLFSTPSIQMPQGAFGPATCGQGSRTFFANALSSPVRSSLQPFHMAHGGVYGGNVLQGSNAGYGAGPDNQVFHSADGSQSADDSAMDMHTEGSSYE